MQNLGLRDVSVRNYIVWDLCLRDVSPEDVRLRGSRVNDVSVSDVRVRDLWRRDVPLEHLRVRDTRYKRFDCRMSVYRMFSHLKCLKTVCKGCLCKSCHFAFVRKVIMWDLCLQDSVQDVYSGIIGYKMSTCEMSVSRMSKCGMSLYKMSMR